MSTQESGHQLVTTKDGSHTLYLPGLDETYHSHHGAVQESRHVFLRMGLRQRLEVHPEGMPLHVLEVGMGTGLNVWLTTAKNRFHQVPLHYTTLEPHPLPPSLVEQLNYANQEEPAMAPLFSQIHSCPWETWVPLPHGVQLLKLQTTLQAFNPSPAQYHVVYFDAFAPSKQAELWTLPLLQKVAQAMAPGGIFVTYSARGQLKRDLATAGLSVETLPGPPGKKEMVRATKPGSP